MDSFEKLLEKSTLIHGHTCAGQVIGVRMAMLGLREIGIDDPSGRQRKDFYVLVEIDRCATDAIQSVCGCSLGKRSLKWLDYGIMAASFVNFKNNKAVRVVAREEARELAKNYCPEISPKSEQQLAAYKLMPEEELFCVQKIKVEIPKEDLPGKPLQRVQCEECGDWVQDCREVVNERDKVKCRPCAFGRYYQLI